MLMRRVLRSSLESNGPGDSGCNGVADDGMVVLLQHRCLSAFFDLPGAKTSCKL